MLQHWITNPLYLAITIGPDGSVSSGTGFFTGTLGQIMTTIANTLIFLTGAIAIIVLIVGAIRYVVSAGNSGSVARAKDTIVYALVGIAGAAAAYAAVNGIAALLSGQVTPAAPPPPPPTPNPHVNYAAPNPPGPWRLS